MSEEKSTTVGATPQNNDVKVALLEQQIGHLERRQCKNEDHIQRISAKLDEKVAADTWRQLESEKTLARILATMESITNDLKEATEAATKAQKMATRHETIAMTVMKVGSVLTVIAGAVWTVANAILSYAV